MFPVVYALFFFASKLSFVFHQWILRQVLKFKPRHAKHHAKHNRWYRYEIMWPLITLVDFSPADFKRFPTVLADRRLFGSHCLFRTGSVANGVRIRMTKRCSALSSRCDLICGLPDLGKSSAENKYYFLNTLDLNTQIWSVNILHFG